jgi:hypothetical protein
VPPPRIAVPVAIAGLAALSLALPFAPLYDPWAWLVWGREVTELDLDTGAGPSWKPLAVMITTPLALAGDAAPALWLWAARAGWLAAAALAYRLAWRLMFPARVATGLATRLAARRVLTGRRFAGALAAIGVVLLFDPFTSWSRQFAGGLSEPLLVALVLGAVDRGLGARHGQALALAFAAALLRPEVWPLLAVYAVALWRREPRMRRGLVGVAVGLPVLWLVPDLLGSGDLFTGAERAREGTGAPLGEAIESLGRSLELPLAALWAGAVAAVVSARRHHEREIVVLAAGTVAWIAIVAALAAAGYAGLPRFAAPAGAMACVLGGVGLTRAVAAVDGMRARDARRRPALVLTGLALAVLAIQGAVRLADVPGELDGAREYADAVDDLEATAEAVRGEGLGGCAPVTTTAFLSVTPLAWQTELALGEVEIRTRTIPAAGVAFVGADEPPPVAAEIERRGRPIGGRGSWAAYEIACPAPPGALVASSLGSHQVRPQWAGFWNAN